MEQTDSLKGAEEPRATGSRRLITAAAVASAVAGILGLGLRGPAVGIAAASGCIAAGVYAFSYLRSHLRPRRKAFDTAIARGMGFRLMVLVVLGFVAWSAGRQALVAYLASFAIGFAILMAVEIPMVSRQLRSRRPAGVGGQS